MSEMSNEYLRGKLDAFELMIEMLEGYSMPVAVKVVKARIEEMRMELELKAAAEAAMDDQLHITTHTP